MDGNQIEAATPLVQRDQGMEPVQLWTGRTACALQAALRMTNESFAAHLGTAVILNEVLTWRPQP